MIGSPGSAAPSLDLAPVREQALYLTAITFGLVQAALQLLVMVFWLSSSSTAPDRTVQEAAGDPGA